MWDWIGGLGDSFSNMTGSLGSNLSKWFGGMGDAGQGMGAGSGDGGYSAGFDQMTSPDAGQAAGSGGGLGGAPQAPQAPGQGGGFGWGQAAGALGGAMQMAPGIMQMFQGQGGGAKGGKGMPTTGGTSRPTADPRAVQSMLANKQAAGVNTGGAVSPESLANIMGTDTYSPEFIQAIMKGGR